jgi:hypothetical protein
MSGSPWPALLSSSPPSINRVSPSLSRVDARAMTLPTASSYPGRNATAHDRAMAAGQVLTRSLGSAPSPSGMVVSVGPPEVKEGGAPLGRTCDGRDSPAYRQAPRPSAIAVGRGSVA